MVILDILVIGMVVYFFRFIMFQVLQLFFRKNVWLMANIGGFILWLLIYRNNPASGLPVELSVLLAAAFAAAFMINDRQASVKNFAELHPDIVKKAPNNKSWIYFMSAIGWVLLVFFSFISIIYLWGFLSKSPKIWIELAPLAVLLFWALYPVYHAKSLKNGYDAYLKSKNK